jgi:putative transposase
MRGPKPLPLTLTEAERTDLDALVRRHSTPQQVALRARVILAAADGLNHAQIARMLHCPLDFARRWRLRWLALQPLATTDRSVADRLIDAPRAGRPAQLTPEQVCQIVRIACEAPTTSGRPITEWTGREIADEAIRRAIVARLSPRHAARLVKRGISSPIGSDPG